MSLSCLPVTLRAASCILGLAVLVGCGNGPSESDIERVVKSTITKERAAAERFAGTSGAGLFPTIHAVKKLGCKEASNSVYACDVELDVTPPGAARTKTATTLRLAKGSDGWVPMR